MRKRFAFVVAIGMLVASFAVQPVSSAVVIKGVSCATSCTYKWKPRTVSVSTGTKVVWKSVNGNHDVTSIGKNWSKASSIPQGQQTSFTFNRTGTFRFVCTLHGFWNSSSKTCTGMCGKVVVG